MTIARAAAAAFLVAFILACGAPRAAAGEASFALHDGFALVHADGKTVRSTDFPGEVLLIYFGYTNCSDQCPTSLSAIAEALEELGPAARHVQAIFVTVDPERDRGPILRSFTEAFDPRILGLGGSADAIGALANSLGIKYQKVLLGEDEDYVIDHATTLSLIDPFGRNAVTFDMAEPYAIAARVFAALQHAGIKLDDVNNLGAYH